MLELECATCGKLFEPITTVGRPRTLCYDCRPYRKLVGGRQRIEKVTAPAAAPTPRKPAPMAAVDDDPKCAWCGAYTTGDPFCNPNHRSLFAQRVADAKRGSPAPPGNARVYGKAKRPLERLREIRAAETEREKAQSKARKLGAQNGTLTNPRGSGIPAEVAYPLDPPRITTGA